MTSRSRADRLATGAVAGCGALAAAAVVLHLGGWTSDGALSLVARAMLIPLTAVFTIFSVRVARQPARDRRARTAWSFIAVALSCQFLAYSAWFVENPILHRTVYPTVGDYLWLAFVPCMLIGLVLLPGRQRTRRDRIRLGLDALIVGLGAFVVLWYVVLGEIFATGGDIDELLYSALLPTGDLMILLALAAALLSRPGRVPEMSLRLIGAALVVLVAGDIGYTYAALRGRVIELDLLWAAGFMLFVLATWQAHREVAGIPGGSQRASRGTVSWLPYVAVALAYGLLAGQARDEPAFPLGGMLIGAVLITLLVVARQMYAQRENRELAVTDTLTGLSNRHLITERLAELAAQPLREGKHTAVLVIDLDRFKPINDTYGHEAGDAVLLAVAVTLRRVIRAGDTAGRLGGDEFAVIMNNLPSHSAALSIADRLAESLRTPVIFGDQLLSVEASIGVALRDSEAIGGEGLLHHAELATAAAKRSGRCTVYSAELDTRARDAELRRAIAADEMVVHFQPAVSLHSRRVVAVEALVRWQHPERGLLYPGEFIELAEETGAIVPLGEWVLRASCREVARWHAEVPGAQDLLLSVNLSPRQVVQARLVDVIQEILADTGFPPDKLILELTESVVLEPDQLTVARLQRLRDLGIRFAVDDFGTGYAALSYLRQLPVSILKIDRSFITGIASDSKARTVAEAVVRLGDAFGLEVVAEGIETAEQGAALREMGCQFGQGFHYCRPLPGEAVERSLRESAVA